MPPKDAKGNADRAGLGARRDSRGALRRLPRPHFGESTLLRRLRTSCALRVTPLPAAPGAARGRRAQTGQRAQVRLCHRSHTRPPTSCSNAVAAALSTLPRGVLRRRPGPVRSFHKPVKEGRASRHELHGGTLAGASGMRAREAVCRGCHESDRHHHQFAVAELKAKGDGSRVEISGCTIVTCRTLRGSPNYFWRPRRGLPGGKVTPRR
jgi:hypothetical protein